MITKDTLAIAIAEAIGEYLTPDGSCDAAAEAVIAALPKCIKPLEWVTFSGDYDTWEAHTSVGIYTVIQYDSHVALLIRNLKRSDFSDVGQAKAFASDHYHSAIMSAFALKENQS